MEVCLLWRVTMTWETAMMNLMWTCFIQKSDLLIKIGC
jgi:hypothetical protein